MSGFKCIREHKIIHRDLKFENILVSKGILKIADFGFYKILNNRIC